VVIVLTQTKDRIPNKIEQQVKLRKRISERTKKEWEVLVKLESGVGEENCANSPPGERIIDQPWSRHDVHRPETLHGDSLH